MSNDPNTIPLDKLADLLCGIGLDPVDMADICSVHMEAGRIQVVRCRLNDRGEKFVAGNEVATETVTIGIEPRLRQVAAVDISAFGDTERRYVVGEH